MGNHYIPRSYLKGFTESIDSSFIFRYEKGSKKVIRTNIKNVAQETGFYSDETEQFLANSLETPVKPILDLLKDKHTITMEEKNRLTDYIVNMAQRVPSSKKRITSGVDKELDPSLDWLEDEIKNLLKTHPDKFDILQKRLKEVAVIRSERRVDTKKIWEKLLSPENYPLIRETLLAMTWQFMAIREDQFLTSDNPVFFFREIGLGRKNSELYFPISTKISLWATWLPKDKEGWHSAKESFVHEMNRRIVSTATRYIFFSKQSQSLVNLINKPKYKIKYLL